MEYGHFFKLDKNSDIINGIVLFEYMGLSFNENQFPIYLSMTNYGISFYLSAHYNLNNNKRLDDELTDCIYRNYQILHLPLSRSVNEINLLSETLNEIFDTDFPRKDSDGSEVEGSNIDFVYNQIKMELNKRKERKLLTYSTLDCFRSEEDQKYFLKVLLLDFIFDLEHTNVFQNSPHYENVHLGLKENPIFQSIANKALFYYLHKQAVTDFSFDEGSNSQPLYGRYLSAINRWVSTININERIINDSSDTVRKLWFRPVFLEIDNVVKSFKISESLYRKNLKEKDSIHKYKKQFIESTCNLSLRKMDIPTLFTLLHSSTLKKWLIILIPILVLVIFSFAYFFYSIEPFFLLPLIAPFVLIFTIFKGRFQYKELYLGLFFPRLLIAITSASFIFMQTEEIWKISYNASLESSIFVFLSLFVVIIIYLFWYISTIDRHVNYRKILLRAMVYLVVGLSFSLIINTFIVSFTAPYLLPGCSFIENQPTSMDEVVKVMNAESYLIKKVYSYGCIYLIPGITFMYSILALFVGIFFTLSFLDRSLSEELK